MTERVFERASFEQRASTASSEGVMHVFEQLPERPRRGHG